MNSTESYLSHRAVAIIPARFASSRLPGKPLLEIAGRPMILWVVERALSARNIERAIVATDDERIIEAVRGAGFEAVMTATEHATGSDRLAEVAATLYDAEIIVNVQGDEPLISPRTIERAVDELANDDEAMIVTTCEEIREIEDVLKPDVVKVVKDRAGRALYFSRLPVPHLRDEVKEHGTLARALESNPALLKNFRKHTGLYAYRRAALLEFTSWPQSDLERLESLEQLRALERGIIIKVIEVDEPSIGVDTVEDLERVRAMCEKTDRALWEK
ncbi:MAG: hypothetical protein AUG51_04500 [Acidobacteria bacterium 13_1_20CM_3_53_8]|nr:MAG: hypothetical protein AUG51_04500 [Acidobacteria bacterium 13_1_20CM_3_53_8]